MATVVLLLTGWLRRESSSVPPTPYFQLADGLCESAVTLTFVFEWCGTPGRVARDAVGLTAGFSK